MKSASLFVRKASGLVRAWSVFDAFIYATFSINLITLGLFIFSYCYYLGGSLATGVVLGAIFTIFEVIVYASLISAMPRAGGDYVWQSRILNRGLGFVLSVTGWWFILWLWTPLYGQMLAYEVYTPLLAMPGSRTPPFGSRTKSGSCWWRSLSVCLIVFIYIAIGMRWYARIQKFCFWGGMAGLAVVLPAPALRQQRDFRANFNALAPQSSARRPAMSMLPRSRRARRRARSPRRCGRWHWASASSWSHATSSSSTCGRTGARRSMVKFAAPSDYKRNFWGMAAHHRHHGAGALILFAADRQDHRLGVLQQGQRRLLELHLRIRDRSVPPLPIWPYPALFATFMVKSPAIQFIVVLLMSLWWFGWSGTALPQLDAGYLRGLHSTACCRSGSPKIEPRTKTPINALLLMVIPAVIISYLYAYNIFGMRTPGLDATVVIAITFLGTTIAGTVMPWRAKDVFDGSPIGKFKVPTWLGWIVTLLYAAPRSTSSTAHSSTRSRSLAASAPSVPMA